MRQPAILAIVWTCALLVLIGTLTKMPDQWHRRDFSNYYESAWAMRHGIDPYSTNLTPIGAQLGLETNWLVHASETPPFLLCFEPLTRMRPRVAFWLWTAINFSALAIAMYLLLVRRSGLSGRTALLLAGLMLMSAPVNLNFYWGQSQLIVLALMVAAMRAMERDRDGTAGLLIAAAALLRAYPLLLVGYFVIRRNWRAVIFATVGIAAGGFATVAILGLSQTLSFVHGALWLTDYRVVNRVDNLSLGPFVSRMFWALTGTAPGSSVDWMRRAAMAIADVVVLGLTIRATLEYSDRRRSRLENLLTVGRDRSHAHARRMAPLPGATGYSVCADGRIGDRGSFKLASDLDGGASLSSQRDFAPRLQPVHGASADRVPTRPSMAGTRARGNELRSIAHRILRSVLVRDRSIPPSAGSSNRHHWH